MDDLLDLWAFDGGSVKTLDDDGRFEGLAIPFKGHDLTKMRDRFDAETNYGRAMKSGADLLYYHGLPKIGKSGPNPLADMTLGETQFEIKTDGPDPGVWARGQITLRDKYVESVKGLVKDGKLGLSTGVAAHRVRREKNKDGSHTLKSWPIDELSFTPEPAHPRTAVYAIKTLMDEDIEVKGLCLGPDAERGVAMSAVYRLGDMVQYKIGDVMADAKMTPDEKKAACQGCVDEFGALAMRIIGALMEAPGDGPAEVKSLIAAFDSRPHRSFVEPPESAGFVESLKRAESALEWAVSRRDLNGSKAAAIKSLTESVKRYRDSRSDPAKVQAAFARSAKLLSRYEG